MMLFGTACSHDTVGDEPDVPGGEGGNGPADAMLFSLECPGLDVKTPDSRSEGLPADRVIDGYLDTLSNNFISADVVSHQGHGRGKLETPQNFFNKYQGGGLGCVVIGEGRGAGNIGTLRYISGGDWAGYWTPDVGINYWPGNTNVDVYAWTPQISEQGRCDVSYDSQNRPLLDISLESSTYYMQDYAVGHVRFSTSGVRPVPVNPPTVEFRHIMAAVKLKFAPTPGRRHINRWDICGDYYDHARYNAASGAWEYPYAKASGKYSWPSGNGGGWSSGNERNLEDITLNDHMYNDLSAGHEDQTLVMIPQTFEAGKVKFIVYFTDGHRATFTLPELELKEGTITTISLQENSYYVECRTDKYQNWDGSDTGGATGIFRLVEDYHYSVRSTSKPWENSAFIDRAVRKYDRVDPSQSWDADCNMGDDNWDWDNNQKPRWGHRSNIVITWRNCTRNYDWDYLCAEDNRYNYFIAGKRRELKYAEAIGTGRPNREDFFLDVNAALASTNAGSFQKGCPWQSLGGWTKMDIYPLSRTIVFEPLERDLDDPSKPNVKYPIRIQVNGSVHGLPNVEMWPYNWNTGNDIESSCDMNKKSFRDHYLYPDGVNSGKYIGWINVTQRMPFIENYRGVSGRHWVPRGWMGYGSVVFYLSTIHGSQGKSVAYHEYESRLGCRNNIHWEGCHSYRDDMTYTGWRTTIQGVGRMYSDSYFKLPVGRYCVRYDINTEEMSIEWDRKLYPDEMKPSMKFAISTWNHTDRFWPLDEQLTVDYNIQWGKYRACSWDDNRGWVHNW